MKTLTLVVQCDIAGCEESGVGSAPTKGTVVARLMDRGWRMGSTRDVCPSCREKGHRT